LVAQIYNEFEKYSPSLNKNIDIMTPHKVLASKFVG